MPVPMPVLMPVPVLRRMSCLLLGIAALAATEAFAAQPVPTPEAVYFSPGSTRGRADGQVERGGHKVYSLKGEAGQRMTVSLTAPRQNAVFSLFPPDTAITRTADGELEFRGKALHDSSAPGADRTRWRGELPATGLYLIVVESTLGPARYSMDIRLE